MNRHSVGLVLGIASTLALPRPLDATVQPSPRPPISKATASVEPVPGQARVVVQIRNLSNVAMEAWRLKVVYDLGPGPTSVDIVSDAGLDPDFPGAGAIGAGTTRRQIVALPGIPVDASVTIVMLILSDGTFEGRKDLRDALLGQRERQAATLSLWIDALQSVSGRQGADAKSQIERIRRSDSRYTPDPLDVWALAMDRRIKELIASREADQLPARLSALLAKYQSQRDLALRHKTR